MCCITRVSFSTGGLTTSSGSPGDGQEIRPSRFYKELVDNFDYG